MNKKVTIQDIADALGVSRNTVSKAINNADGIADSTRERIIQKAIEMDYKQFSYVSSVMSLSDAEASSDRPAGEISVFTTTYLSQSNFESMVMDRIHEELARMGYTLSIHRVGHKNIRTLTLPRTFDRERTRAIICAEVLDPAYCDMLCDMDIPLLFMDGPARRGARSVRADQLLSENVSEIFSYIHLLLEKKLTRIGFIGDYDHCQSFWERYAGFRLALMSEGVPVDERFIIKPQDRNIDDLGDRLDALEEMPDAFICANDFVAIDAMQLLAQKDENILNKVRFLGFDDTHESKIFFPAFSTIHIHSQAMAYSALQLLISRIKDPNIDYRTIHVATDLVLREHEDN